MSDRARPLSAAETILPRTYAQRGRRRLTKSATCAIDSCEGRRFTSSLVYRPYSFGDAV